MVGGGGWIIHPSLGHAMSHCCIRIDCAFTSLDSVNSVRLWLPQIFATMHIFEVQGARDRSMCAVLEYNSRQRFNGTTTQAECDIVGRLSIARCLQL